MIDHSPIAKTRTNSGFKIVYKIHNTRSKLSKIAFFPYKSHVVIHEMLLITFLIRVPQTIQDLIMIDHSPIAKTRTNSGFKIVY